MPPNKNAAFKGYHLPFIGYTYTENSLINDCQSLYDIIQSNNSIDYANSTANKSTTPLTQTSETKSNKDYECIIAQLENDKIELTTKLNSLQSVSLLSTKNNTNNESTLTLNAPSTPTALNGSGEINEPAATASDIVTKELTLKLDQSQQALVACTEQIAQLNVNLNEMTCMYETAKQNELEEKNKIKHLERSVRALKIEKDQLFTVS